MVSGLLMGLLAFARSGNWPTALLAAFAAAGATLAGLPLLL
ncbi:hypothetical protein [Streptomyces sp. NPDC052701]